MDFNEEAPPQEYLFHRLSENRKEIGSDQGASDPKEDLLVAGGQMSGQAL